MAMQKMTRIGKMATAVLAVVALCYFQPFSWQDILSFGEKMAVVSAGMQQPKQAVLALSEQFHKAHPTTTTTTATTTTTPSSSPTAPVPTNSPPPQSQKGGQVLEQKLSVGTPVVDQVAWANRCGEEVDIPAHFNHQPDITLKDTNKPQVLIVHTHTTESYLTYYAGYYNDSDVARTKNNQKNVVAVGDEIARQLESAGIGVIHDTTIHDSPEYTGAYDRSADTIQKNLEQYPSIQVVLDIHRDAIMPDDTTKIKPTVVIDGQKAAQVMVIAGAVSTEDQPHPHWQENLRLALKLQNQLATDHPGLARPLSVVASRYNQHLTKGSLLIEIGSDANTVGEAVYAGRLAATSLATVLQQLKE